MAICTFTHLTEYDQPIQAYTENYKKLLNDKHAVIIHKITNHLNVNQVIRLFVKHKNLN